MFVTLYDFITLKTFKLMQERANSCPKLHDSTTLCLNIQIDRPNKKDLFVIPFQSSSPFSNNATKTGRMLWCRTVIISVLAICEIFILLCVEHVMFLLELRTVWAWTARSMCGPGNLLRAPPRLSNGSPWDTAPVWEDGDSLHSPRPSLSLPLWPGRLRFGRCLLWPRSVQPKD